MFGSRYKEISRDRQSAGSAYPVADIIMATSSLTNAENGRKSVSVRVCALARGATGARRSGKHCRWKAMNFTLTYRK